MKNEFIDFLKRNNIPVVEIDGLLERLSQSVNERQRGRSQEGNESEQPRGSRSSGSTPVEIRRFDTTENGERVTYFVVELPGVKEEDVELKVSLREGVSIKAPRRIRFEHAATLFEGVFSKIHKDSDVKKASATMKDGILTVKVPLIEDPSKTIKVNATEE